MRELAASFVLAGVFTLVLAPAGRLHAQTSPEADAPAFEVASVKANRSGDPGIRFMAPPDGRFTASNAPLRELIRMAFQLQPFQIVGGPSWMDNERFDIVAKAPAGTPPAGPPGTGGPNTMQRMVQSLLADRFKLKAHRETREMPIYALVLARADGKLGPKMEVSTTDCAALMSARARGAGPAPPPPLQPGERPQCGMFMGPGNVGAGDVSMSQFANALGMRLGRSVVDHTGLTAKYAFSLEFTPDQLPFGPPGAAPVPTTVDPDRPSLFTALQEQLGLKLDSQRGPVEVLVIDSVEHPTED